MAGGQGLRGLHEAGARSAQSEPSALIGHPLLELHDFRVQRIGRLRRLGGARDFALELGVLGVLGLERLAPLVRA